MAGRHDIYLNQGETFYRSFQWLLEDETGVRTPVDLTGYSGRCQIRHAPPNPLTINVPVSIDGATEGGFFIALSAEQTAGIAATGKGYDKPDKYVYDIELYSNDETYRVVNGYLYVSPEVTK